MVKLHLSEGIANCLHHVEVEAINELAELILFVRVLYNAEHSFYRIQVRAIAFVENQLEVQLNAGASD